jgi:DNA adenine methylase
MPEQLLDVSPDTLGPPLKWAGGKRWLVPRLRELYAAHRHRRLVEPFVGGLGVSLGLRPERALLNDINPHAISFYRWLQRGLTVDVEMRNDRPCYDAARARFNALVSAGEGEGREVAGLFYYLNRTCYNGLCRFNRSGGFNVPFGRYKTINYTEDFSAYVPVLAKWQFQCGDFQQLEVAPDDFLYADPPYDVEFRQYSSGGFAWEDQERLARWLAGHPGPVVTSNQATERVLDLYRDLRFTIEEVWAPRLIACNGDRQPAREMLATRNL